MTNNEDELYKREVYRSPNEGVKEVPRRVNSGRITPERTGRIILSVTRGRGEREIREEEEIKEERRITIDFKIE